MIKLLIAFSLANTDPVLSNLTRKTRLSFFLQQPQFPPTKQSGKLHNGQFQGHAILHCNDNGNPRTTG